MVRKEIIHTQRARNLRETKASLNRIACLLACTGGKEQLEVIEQLEAAVANLRGTEAWDSESEELYKQIADNTLAL